MKEINRYLLLKVFAPLAALAVSIASCIQNEPPNPEADILSFALPGDMALTAAVVNRNDISIAVRKNADLTSVVPIIEITPGATLSPAPGTPCDLTRAVTYTVTSESGEYTKTYTVTAIAYSLFSFNFEHWDETVGSNSRYETPVEYNAENERIPYWASGNTGVVMYIQHTNPSLYPVHKTSIAVSGDYAAEMVTQKGPGKIFNQNISVVAGSLFTGSFNLLSAMINPLMATRFGQSCDAKPLRFTGYYKYKAGDGDYIASNGDVLPNRKDSCSVYSVFFKTDEKTSFLDGTNILSHPNVVAVAKLADEGRAGTPGDDFVYFDIPFEYRNDEVDFENNNYKLAVIFSSSHYGDRYEGAPGSVLIVDNIEIVTE